MDFYKVDVRTLSTEYLEQVCKEAQRELAGRHKTQKAARAINFTPGRSLPLHEALGQVGYGKTHIDVHAVIIPKQETVMTEYIKASPLHPLNEEYIPIIPVMITETEKYFAQGGNIEFPIHSLGKSYMTGPLAVNQKIDLLGLSQVSELISSGMLDVATTIHPDVFIKAIYLSVEGSVLRFNVRDLPQAKGQTGLIADTRGLNFQINNDNFLIDSETRDINGVAPWWIRQLYIAEVSLILRVNFNGTVATSRGNIIFGGGAEINTVVNDKQPSNAKVNGIILSLFNEVEIIGFDLEAYFTK